MSSGLPPASWPAPPDRPPAFVLNLARMPAGMVDQILDDLPIARVLQILRHGTQFLKDCIFTHHHYRRLFHSPSSAEPALARFRLHCDIAWFKRQPLSPRESYIANVYVPQRQLSPSDYPKKLYDVLAKMISNEIYLRPMDEHILSINSLTPCPKIDIANISVMQSRWDWIKEKKMVLNQAKARQLNMVADIISDYPGRLRLKKPTSPYQNDTGPNAENIINGFREAARRALKDRNINHGLPGRCTKATDYFHVIPYDKYLWLFLDTMKKYPPANEGCKAQDVGQLLGKSTLAGNLGRKFQYPESIATSIGVVNKGLINVYTGSPLLVIPRIDWKPANSPSGSGKPIFLVDTKPHPTDFPQELHRCLVHKVMPYDEREYEWLKVFLEVVAWIESNLPEMEKAASGFGIFRRGIKLSYRIFSVIISFRSKGISSLKSKTRHVY